MFNHCFHFVNRHSFGSCTHRTRRDSRARDIPELNKLSARCISFVCFQQNTMNHHHSQDTAQNGNEHNSLDTFCFVSSCTLSSLSHILPSRNPSGRSSTFNVVLHFPFWINDLMKCSNQLTGPAPLFSLFSECTSHI